MDTLNCSNVMELANEVKEHLNTGKEEYIARPFNRFDPANTVWWITPGSDWPAYKYGKYGFRRDNDIIYVGLNIEKGYGKEASSMVSNNAIMTEEWIWHEFMEAASQGELNKTIDILDQKTASNVHIFLGFGVFNEVNKNSGDFSEMLPNHITYIFKRNSIQVQNKDQQMRDERFEKLKQSGSVQKIFAIMSKIKQLNYFWVDFFVEVPYKIKDNDKELEIYKLDNQVLSVLGKWVK